MSKFEGCEVLPADAYEVTQMDLPALYPCVQRSLSTVFDFNPAQGGIFLGYDSPEQKQVLALRGYNEEQIKQEVKRRHNSTMITSDVHDLGILSPDRIPYSYYIFVRPNLKPGIVLSVLGEEVVHGEHRAHMRRTQKIGPDQYGKRFPKIVREFLGKLGTHALEQEWKYDSPSRDYSLSNAWKPEALSHNIQYAVVGEAVAAFIKLTSSPNYRGLFHAPDARAFWEVVKQDSGGRLQIPFKVPLDWSGDLDLLERSVSQEIFDAKAAGILTPLFVSEA